METVKLKNGREEPAVLVAATMVSLSALFVGNPITFYDLVMLVREGTPPFGGMAQFEAASMGLVQNGQVHESIRNVVLSAAEGDGLDMALTDPVAR